MIIFVVGENKTFRHERIASAVSSFNVGEMIVLDDTLTSVLDLEQYAYPSLFSVTMPVVHVKFLLDGKVGDFSSEMIKKLHASPTLFLFEEFSMPAALGTQLKKHSVEVYAPTKEAKAKSFGDIFSVTKAITAVDKKERWFAYRDSIEHHAIEAVIGILYWKIRDLVSKEGKDASKYKSLYNALLTAHAKAWETGAPLELLIEKVILEQ